MRDVTEDAQVRPEFKRVPMLGAVEAEETDRGIVETVEDVGAGAEVIHALGEEEVACVEDGAPKPAENADVGESSIVLCHGVTLGELLIQDLEPAEVHVAVQDGEDDGEGFLDAEDAEEGPFPVELLDGETFGDAGGGDAALAGVVAVLGTGPEEEAEVEGQLGLLRVGTNILDTCLSSRQYLLQT